MDVRALLARLPVERWRNPPPNVAVLQLGGVIGRAGRLRAGLALEGLAEAIERAFSLPRLKAVALAVNSPGGSPAQSALIHRRIRDVAAEKKIPVFAFVEDVAASGGYWLANAADEIFALDSSIVGSIGVVSAGFGFTDFIQRFGIERRVHAAGERKMLLDPFRPEIEDEVARLKAIQADIHDTFKDLVRASRGARLKAPESELFTGEFWTGRRALDLGLIDGIGDLRTVMRQRFGEKVALCVVPHERRRLLRRISPFLGAGALASPGLADDLIAAVEEKLIWSRFGL